MYSSLIQKEAAAKRPQTFKKGNTIGKLKGKSFKTLVKEAYREVMVEEKVKTILMKVQDGAAKGDSQCLQFYFQYMLPKLPETSSPFEWPKDIRTHEQRKEYAEVLLQKYANQECSKEELDGCMDSIDKYQKTILCPEVERVIEEMKAQSR